MKVAIREAVPADAEQIIALVQKISAEPDVDIALSPGEFDHTNEAEQTILAEFAASENSIYLVAEAGDRIIGFLNCKGGNRKATRHVALLSISVDAAWRNQGVGSQLMARAVRWAQDTGIITRIELLVFARNAMAIHLYQKFGFVVEGRQKRAIFRNGEYLDDLMMALLLLQG
jgi:L-phenylalanine/L-methionine N-acetyltransferase